MQTQSKIIVGLSGGVDSAVAAYLLQQQGYAVEGMFMKNWEADDSDTHCTAEQDLRDVQQVCEQLHIRLHVVNFAREYWDNVFQYFLDEYQAGRTPNPDILCNREIKFKAFLDHALALGADKIATGHYVHSQQINNEIALLKAKDENKDQSYFLYTLQQAALNKSVFPLGELTKPEVRALAQRIGFNNYAKRDSTGICFIGERNFKAFLQEYLLGKPGPIKRIDDNKTLGTHDGLMYYTIGQRRGIHIGGIKNTKEAPWYVVVKNMAENILYVAQGSDHPALYAKTLICSQASWIRQQPHDSIFYCKAKVRYRQAEQACEIRSYPANADKALRYEITFMEPQWAITPGQSIVFYQGDECLGGAIIETVL